MVNSRAKGQRGELQARDLCRTFWYAPECERAGQTNGKVCADLVRALPSASVEVKNVASIGAFKFMEQSMKDARKEELPIVMMRQGKTPLWLLMLEATKLEQLVARFLRAMYLTKSPEFVDKFVSDALHSVK